MDGSKMENRKLLNLEVCENKLEYGELPSINFLRELFDVVEKKFPEYSDFTVEFYSYANDGDYDRGDPEASVTFYGKRLENDAEYERRLEHEKKLEQVRLKHKEEEEERKQKQIKEHEEWEKQEFERLKKKYGR